MDRNPLILVSSVINRLTSNITRAGESPDAAPHPTRPHVSSQHAFAYYPIYASTKINCTSHMDMDMDMEMLHITQQRASAPEKTTRG